eukprot:SAG31_NODE_809_length_11922_cov_15.915504_9_plen_150_part_00
MPTQRTVLLVLALAKQCHAQCAGGTGASFEDSGTIVAVYEDNAECLWTLSCSASSAIATVTFSAFDMEINCEYLRRQMSTDRIVVLRIITLWIIFYGLNNAKIRFRVSQLTLSTYTTATAQMHRNWESACTVPLYRTQSRPLVLQCTSG